MSRGFISSISTASSSVFKDSVFLDARRGYNPSFMWRSVWGSKSLLLEGLEWCVGSGMCICVWDDAWIMGDGTHCVPTPSETSNMEMRVCELIDFERGGWDVEQVQQTFIEEEWQQVLGIPLSRSWPADNLYWWPSRNGIFTVRSCYWLGRMGHLRTWRLQYGARETELWREVLRGLRSWIIFFGEHVKGVWR